MAKDMNQGTVFTLVTNKGPPIIKVTNTEMKLHTFWPLDKYGDRLEQIREAYNNRDTGDDSSGDLASLFFDADDTWQKEEGDHAGGSLNGSSNSDLRKVLDSIKYGESHPEAASEVALRRRSSMRVSYAHEFPSAFCIVFLVIFGFVLTCASMSVGSLIF